MNFFKKIRRKLLAKGKTWNYVRYALGEIILVVIGILIALQLNILKEDSHEKNATKELLLGVQADLQLEHERLDFLIAFYSEITDGIQEIILTHQGKSNPSNEELGKYFLNVFEIRKFSKFSTNYQTLYVSGLLQGIENKELSEEIITYYTKQFLEWSLDVYQQKAGSFDFNSTDQFDPLDKLRNVSKYQSIPNFQLDVNQPFSTDFKAFTNDPKVLNYLVDLLHQSELVYTNLNMYKESNQALSGRIKTYLDQ